MSTRRKTVLIAVGVLAAVCLGALAAMRMARHSLMERELRAAEAAPLSVAPVAPGAAVLQLPKLVVHSARDGIAVIISNDACDRRVVIDPDNSTLIIEVEYAPDTTGPRVRRIPLDARTLAPGEATEPLSIPIQGRWESAKVRFEHRDYNNVCYTSWTPVQ